MNASLTDVVRALRELSSSLSTKKDSELKQYASHSMKRLAELAAPEVRGAVSYSSKRVQGGNVAGLVCDAVGAAGTLKFTRHVLTCMATDRTYASKWFKSKSAVSHARHIAKKESKVS